MTSPPHLAHPLCDLWHGLMQREQFRELVGVVVQWQADAEALRSYCS